MADSIDYIFQFPDRATALRDSIVGPYFNSPPAGTPVEVLVYRDTRIDSVSAQPGFWFIIETSGHTAALAAHPNVQIINDRTLQLAGQPSVVSSKFDTAHSNIIFSNFGTYAANGLQISS